MRDGGGAGIPVLLIHGSIAKDFLLPVAKELSATGRFRVVSYERRGYGRKKADPVDMKGKLPMRGRCSVSFISRRRWNSRIAMVRIPGATHFFPMTHPKETAAAIADFCGRIES